MIVTIDGPAGSGKSTAARKLAAGLGIAYLDTGAMYRAVAYQILRAGLDPQDGEAVLGIACTIDLLLDCGPTFTRVKVDGHDISEAIRSMAVSRATSYVARHAAVRKLLVDKQQAKGRELGDFVTEGRDQGSVVFPSADFKFVLEASLDTRAQRRFDEMRLDGEDVSLQEVRDSLEARDRVDFKQWEPLLRSQQAVVIDTTGMTIHDVVERMAECLKAQRRV